LTPIEMSPIKRLSVLGSAAKLNQPREAVTLPNGHVVVADTGNGRLVILDHTGHLLRVVRRGAAPFQQPFAVATMGTGFVVLDSERGSLDLLNAGGGFVRELMHAQQLSDARGLAVGPHDQLYVANPRSNSILVLSPQGTVVHTFTGPLSAAPGGFNQPSDVAVEPTGTLYVLDNVNNRIEALAPTRAFVQQWPAPGSDTVFSVHLLPLADGRLVASDPAGALVVYRHGDRTPARFPFQQGGQGRTQVEPVGLALGPHGTLLVTDAQGGTVLLVPLADLSH
jgi:DNA-binding beta-propeller fold protein YncE